MGNQRRNACCYHRGKQHVSGQQTTDSWHDRPVAQTGANRVGPIGVGQHEQERQRPERGDTTNRHNLPQSATPGPFRTNAVNFGVVAVQRFYGGKVVAVVVISMMSSGLIERR